MPSPEHLDPANKAVEKSNPVQEHDNNKLKVTKPKGKHSKGVKEVASGKVNQDIKSVQRKQKSVNKTGTKRKSIEEGKDAVIGEGIQKGKKAVKKSVVTPKLIEERDSTKSPTRNTTLNFASQMSSFDAETPPEAESSPKPVSPVDVESTPGQLVCLCPFQCGFEPCEIDLMKLHIIENHPEREKKDQDTSTTVEEDNIVRKTFMLSAKGQLTNYNFNKLMKENHFMK